MVWPRQSTALFMSSFNPSCFLVRMVGSVNVVFRISLISWLHRPISSSHSYFPWLPGTIYPPFLLCHVQGFWTSRGFPFPSPPSAPTGGEFYCLGVRLGKGVIGTTCRQIKSIGKLYANYLECTFLIQTVLIKTLGEERDWHSDLWWKGCMGQKSLRTTVINHRIVYNRIKEGEFSCFLL